MERATHGGVQSHTHRKASEHWGRIRTKKDKTAWIVLAATVAASVILGVLYLLLS